MAKRLFFFPQACVNEERLAYAMHVHVTHMMCGWMVDRLFN
jgi:hypothetical protein